MAEGPLCDKSLLGKYSYILSCFSQSVNDYSLSMRPILSVI